MSISAFQDRVFKSGCGIAVLFISTIALAGGLFYTSCAGDVDGLEGKPTGTVAVQVGEATITAQDLDNRAKAMLANFQGMEMNPRMQTFALAQAMDGSIREAAYFEVAKRMGVSISDESIRAAVKEEIDKILEGAREQFISEKKLKPDASQKEFDEVFKKERGQTTEEFRKTVMDDIGKVLADPDQRTNLLAQLGIPNLIFQQVKSKQKVTDAQLKSSYDQFSFKRVFFPAGPEAENNAKKAKAELDGGASFEQVMEKYSGDTPAPDKKISESVVKLPRLDIETNPDLKPLMNLKDGEVSGVMTVPGGQAIYKRLSMKNELPPDFQKDIEKYREEYARRLVNQEIDKNLQAIVKSDAVKFPLEGYRLLNEYTKFQQDTSMSPGSEARTAKLKEIADAAEKATQDAVPADDATAALVWYSAFEDRYNTVPDRAPLREERVRVLEGILRYSESFDIRMDLADMGIEMKNPDIVATNLTAAIRSNVSYDVQGDERFRQINDKINLAKESGALPEEAEAELKRLQADWRNAKAENAKQEAQFKAEQEKAAKEAEEAQKKLDEENKKAMEQQKKEGTTGTNG